jgi:formylglycine-generating enzyme required for sulfatase activity
MFLLFAALQADEFGEGDLRFHIDFAPIAANQTTTDSYGEDWFYYTDYDYRIGRTEISIAQILQARAADSRICGTEVNYWNSESVEHPLGVHVPATKVDVYDIFRFCNWLTSGDPYQGAYLFDTNGTLDLDNYVDRSAALAKYDTVYVIPTNNEWKKAAFFKPDQSRFSFLTNGAGNTNIPEGFPENPVDIMYLPADNFSELEPLYYDSEGVAHEILPEQPERGSRGGWNNAIQVFPWNVGSSQKEQNGTYDMFGNVAEYYEDIILTLSGRDYYVHVTQKSDEGKNLGGNTWHMVNTDRFLVLINSPTFYVYPAPLSLTVHPYVYGYHQTKLNTTGFRVAALGAVPEVNPMPEVSSAITNGAAKVSWPSVVGRIYQLQYSDSLETPNWTNIGKGVHGSGGTEFVIVPVDTDAKKIASTEWLILNKNFRYALAAQGLLLGRG